MTDPEHTTESLTERLGSIDSADSDARELALSVWAANALTLLREKDKRLARTQEASGAFNDIVDLVEGRCMAADGPVTPTLREMSEHELRQLWLNVQLIRRALSNNSGGGND